MFLFVEIMSCNIGFDVLGILLFSVLKIFLKITVVCEKGEDNIYATTTFFTTFTPILYSPFFGILK